MNLIISWLRNRARSFGGRAQAKPASDFDRKELASLGSILVRKVEKAPTLGFIPVAVHFELFQTLVKLGKPASPAEVVEAVAENKNVKSPLNLRLAEDVLFIMAGHGLWDLVDQKYQPNDITRHMVANPSCIHGALFYTSEALLTSAFIYPKLLDTNFEYPFQENETPFQYAHEKMGNAAYSKLPFYNVMIEEGRVESVGTFMEKKWGNSPIVPARMKEFGYDLDSVMQKDDLKVVDIGGGQGELLLHLKEAYPALKKENLITQDFNAATDCHAEVTGMDWDYKAPGPQPIEGADVYNTSNVFHNLPDIECMQLLKKIAEAMGPHSRLWIHEFPKILNNSHIHAGMIAWLGGRERSSEEWHAMAGIAGLRVTFEAYPAFDRGLVEMLKF